MGEKLTRRDAIRAGLGAAICAALAPALGALRPLREVAVAEDRLAQTAACDLNVFTDVLRMTSHRILLPQEDPT